MDVDALPHPDRLWWPFALRAAVARAEDDPRWRYDTRHRMLRHDDGDARLRMHRIQGERAVLWGAWPDHRTTSTWTGIPGWATSDVVQNGLRRDGATFVVWHTRHGWDTATPGADLTGPVTRLLEPALPEDLVSGAAAGSADPAALRPLLAGADPAPALAVLAAAATEERPGAGVRRLVAAEIRAQMRLTRDRDRVLPQRPVPLVRWARVADLAWGFQYAVHLQGDRLEPARGNSTLPDQFRLTLHNVLERLHVEEATDDGGCWLFARVRWDGVTVHLDRAFDGRPTWYEDDGPTLRTLAAEMARRDPAWRPAWTRLL
ncbi:MAG: hypothetical protein ACTHNS_13495 [Marmoricola sp.]